MPSNDQGSGRSQGQRGGRTSGGNPGRGGGQRQGGGQRRAAPDPGEFLNPYTFVATPRRDTEEGPLADEAPASHGRHHDGLWSGSIALEIEATTPWLIPDASRRTEARGVAGHFVYDIRTRWTNGGEEPVVPVTTLKGALRSAYEVVTNSRFGVFQGHDRPLGYRMDAREGVRLVPARVDEDGTLGLLLGVNDGLPDRGKSLQTLPAAWLPTYDRGPEGTKVDCLPEVNHGDEVIIEVDRIERWAWDRRGTRGTMHLVRVTSLEVNSQRVVVERPKLRFGNDRDQKGNTEKKRYIHRGSIGRTYRGWVFRTNANIKNKHEERVFFGRRVPADFAQGFDLTRLAEFYDDVCNSYANAHDPDEVWGRRDGNKQKVHPSTYLPPGSPGKAAWAPHLYDKDRSTMFEAVEGQRTVKKGFLCYARLDAQNHVDGLFPVNIARDLWPDAPEALLDPSLRPAPTHSDLSPAERVFGWVAPRNPNSATKADRGRLRIRSVSCDDPSSVIGTPFEPPLPLAILGAPKPTQAAFYVGDQDGRPRPATGRAKGSAYQNGNRLRGRKVYWHHATPESYWDPSATEGDASQVPIEGRIREYVRPRKAVIDPNDWKRASKFDPRSGTYETTGEPQRDNQNRSVRRWIEPGATFTVDLDVTNLSAAELGGLLYLASLGDSRCALHVGGGKPLGFGSARLAITETNLYPNGELAAAYRELREPEPVGADEVARVIEVFKEAADQSVLDAFEQTATPQNAPIHYPRSKPQGLQGGAPVPPDPQGRSYEWFGNHKGRPLPTPEDSGEPEGRLPY
jgi:CRISPR-associated protein (TIGR03986 family)